MRIIASLAFLLISSISYGQLKQIAITVDDVPFAFGHKLADDEIEQAAYRLLDKLNKNSITATGLINGKQIADSNNPDMRWRITKAWLENGQGLGNHTIFHLR